MFGFIGIIKESLSDDCGVFGILGYFEGSFRRIPFQVIIDMLKEPQAIVVWWLR